MFNKKCWIAVCAAVAVALAMATPAHAATITWGNTQAITTGSSSAGATDVLKTGDIFSVDGGTTTLTAGAGIEAVSGPGPNNVDGSATVDGVYFGQADIWSDLNETTAISTVLGGNSTGDSEYDTLIGTMDRTGADPATITLSGLTADTDYVVQVWYADSRQTDREMTFAGTNALTLLAKDWEFGDGIFTADGTTQDLSITSMDTGKIHIAAYQVREFVPEPGTMTLALLALGGLGLFLCRRR